MGVGPDDAVIGAEPTDGQGQIFIGTRGGMAIRFAEADVRVMGRMASGVRGISLRKGDEVVAMTVVRPADPPDGDRKRGLGSAPSSVNTACNHGGEWVSLTSTRASEMGVLPALRTWSTTTI